MPPKLIQGQGLDPWSFFLFMENMITLTDLIILALACFRLTNFIVDEAEAGPFEMFDKIRYWLGWRYIDGKKLLVVDDDAEYKRIRMMILEASDCVWCLSVWTGGLLAISYYFFPRSTVLVCLPFALSTVAILVKKRSR